MTKSFSPLRYPGGKGQMYDTIVQILQDNHLENCNYIEPFAGGAGVALKLLSNGIVKSITLNDFDLSIYAFWYSILYDTERFIRKIITVEINMQEWKKQRIIQLEKENVPLFDLGFSTFFLNRKNRSGIIKGGVIGGKNQDSFYKMDCRFNKKRLIALIEKISTLKDKITIYNLDAEDFIIQVKQKNSFYFIDPPYFCKGKQLYTNFFKPEDHLSLFKTIQKNLKNRSWMVTYDKCDEIYQIYKKQKYRIMSLNYSAQNKKKAEEYMFYKNITIKEDV